MDLLKGFHDCWTSSVINLDVRIPADCSKQIPITWTDINPIGEFYTLIINIKKANYALRVYYQAWITDTINPRFISIVSKEIPIDIKKGSVQKYRSLLSQWKNCGWNNYLLSQFEENFSRSIVAFQHPKHWVYSYHAWQRARVLRYWDSIDSALSHLLKEVRILTKKIFKQSYLVPRSC